MKFEHYFISAGTTREKSDNIGNEVWLDIGNRVEIGTFDHHCDKNKYKSTMDVFDQERELLRNTIERLTSTETVRIFLHTDPDLDAMFAAYIFQHCSEIGFDIFECAETWNTIVEYVNNIDQGKRKNINGWTLYNLICRLDEQCLINYWGIDSNYALNHKMLETGMRWVEKAILRLKNHDDHYDIYKDELFDQGNADDEARLVMQISDGKSSYENDKRIGNLTIKNIDIWTKSGSKASVKAAIWKKNPTDPATSYLIAREEGAVVTFVPNEADDGTRHVMLSVNSDVSEAKEYSLKEVGELYEQMEQIYDKSYSNRNKVMRRHYSKPRGDGKSSVFMEPPFSYTSDPWYVTEDYSMVAAPSVGSMLSYTEMIEILENITRMIKRSYMVSYDLALSKRLKKESYVDDKNLLTVKVEEKSNAGNKSLFNWCKEVNGDIVDECGNNHFPFVIAEVDAQLLTYSYDILNAVFMNLSDGAYLDADERSVLRLDYRTHLYVNQRNAVVFVATNELEDNKNLMGGMLEIDSDDKVRGSKIVTIINNVLYQREMIKEIGEFIGGFRKNKKDLKKKREELIELLAWAQAKECLDTQIEHDSYKFIATTLEVQELRESVRESMEMISEYTNESVYGKLEGLSQLAIPFVLVATVFQMGLLRFLPALNLAEGGCIDRLNIVAWIITAFVIVLITWGLRSGGRK